MADDDASDADVPRFLFATCQLGAEGALKAEVARRCDFRLAYSRPGFLTFKLPPDARAGRRLRPRGGLCTHLGLFDRQDRVRFARRTCNAILVALARSNLRSTARLAARSFAGRFSRLRAAHHFGSAGSGRGDLGGMRRYRRCSAADRTRGTARDGLRPRRAGGVVDRVASGGRRHIDRSGAA